MFEKDKQEHVMDGHTVEVRKEVGYEDDKEKKIRINVNRFFSKVLLLRYTALMIQIL